MHRLLLMFILIVAFGPDVTMGQQVVIGEACVIENGRLQKIASLNQIGEYVTRQDSTGKGVPVGLNEPLNEGDIITARAGVNLKLNEGSGSSRWMNYNTRVNICLLSRKGIELIDGSAIKRGKGTMIGSTIRAITDGTEYYMGAEGEAEIVYVFDGKVEVKHVGGSSLALGKGEAVEGTADGLRKVDMFEPDRARIEKWRDELQWHELSWFGRLIRWPARHPVITSAAIGALMSGVIMYEIGQGDSDVTVRVNIPSN